ncbi:DUF1269 domain-containing protein [Actinoplanes sp. DH11]|uniref:DUF1269 domain-containing protein n=1 Tax=Actinoplanes sp. DH11 TaxID=2857011 RepID=UPI001E4F75A8|nr:DUF1269 domain-containing protein [Actinoplanes sp. DH11]
MTTFTVWKFDEPGRAEQMSRILHDAARDGLVKIGGVLGAGIGALDESLQGTGIGRAELERIRTQITEGEVEILNQTFGDHTR